MPSESQQPATLMDDLRAILAVDKLPIAFLLGAGCPCSIRSTAQGPSLIPDARGLTARVVAEAPDELKGPLTRLQTMLSEDEKREPTVEHMLTRVRTMAAVVGNEEVRGFSASALEDIEQHICRTISTVVNQPLPDPPTPYHVLARWVGGRTSKSVIFTTNYDLLTEQALEALRVPFFDGFIGSYKPFFSQRALERPDLPPDWTLLCKIHGSINWQHLPEDNNIVRSRDTDAGEQLLIHPSHLKYAESRRMPYFVMLDRLKAFVESQREPSALFLVGYSLSDDHINDTIADSLQSNPSAVYYALQYGCLSEYPQAFNLARRCSNLHVITRDQALSGRGTSPWTAPHDQLDRLDGAFAAAQAEVHLDGGGDRLECLLGDFGTFTGLLETISRTNGSSKLGDTHTS